MTWTRFIANVENPTYYGAGNPAQVHFDCDSGGPLSPSSMAASILAWLAYSTVIAANSKVTSITQRLSTAGGATPVPFPTTEYASRKAAYAGLPTMTSYGVSFGSGTPAALGTSVTCSLYTGVAGRHGTGRIYVPFVGTSNTSGGFLDSTGQGALVNMFNAMFLGITGTGFTLAFGQSMCVHSATIGENAITGITVSTALANLHSRRR